MNRLAKKKDQERKRKAEEAFMRNIREEDTKGDTALSRCPFWCSSRSPVRDRTPLPQFPLAKPLHFREVYQIKSYLSILNNHRYYFTLYTELIFHDVLLGYFEFRTSSYHKKD
jgi:hypothetical protein